MKLDTDLSPLKKLGRDAWIPGKVTHLDKDGLRVAIELPSKNGDVRFEGYVPVGEIRKGYVPDASAEADVGDSVRLRLLTTDDETGEASFSMKPKPNLSAFMGLSTDSWLTATVVGVMPAGILVVVPPPSVGEPLETVVQPARSIQRESLRVGLQVKVRILRKDEASGTVELTMEKPTANPIDEPST